MIAWLNNQDSLHQYGIEILSKNSIQLLEVERILISICSRYDCKYFIQGKEIKGYNLNNWLFVEFLGENDQNKMLTVIQDFSIYWYDDLYNHEVLLFEPSRELLKNLNLFR